MPYRGKIPAGVFCKNKRQQIRRLRIKALNPGIRYPALALLRKERLTINAEALDETGGPRQPTADDVDR